MKKTGFQARIGRRINPQVIEQILEFYTVSVLTCYPSRFDPVSSETPQSRFHIRLGDRKVEDHFDIAIQSERELPTAVRCHHYLTITSRYIRWQAANASRTSVFSVSSAVFQFALEQPLSNRGEGPASRPVFPFL